MSIYIDENGVINDEFLVYLSNQESMSKETKITLKQIKALCKETYPEIPTFTEMIPYVFLMGYGACVWDNKIGFENKE